MRALARSLTGPALPRRASELGLPHHVHESMDHLIDGLLNEASPRRAPAKPTCPTSCGACERIIKTPIPLSYSRHCSRFLTLWCATLPFVLVRDLGWAIIPVTAMLTYAVVGIEVRSFRRVWAA
eukprot:tig00000215_g18546.t1